VALKDENVDALAKTKAPRDEVTKKAERDPSSRLSNPSYLPSAIRHPHPHASLTHPSPQKPFNKFK